MIKPLKIAIQGYIGCFHQIAAIQYFGPDIEVIPCDTFREVARKVCLHEADYGVMAIENSIAGSILPNYSILQDEKVQVKGEIYLKIVQNLMAVPGTKLEDITEVESHPMALLQCSGYLDEHPWKLIESIDTALSAKDIAEQNAKNKAAIAPALAAELYGLDILQEEINTIKKNYTRFMVLERHNDEIDPKANKASLYFKTSNEQGALMVALAVLNGVNMTKLQSYPIPSEPWHYLFHIDIEFDTLKSYHNSLRRLKTVTEEVHVYGVYENGLKKEEE